MRTKILIALGILVFLYMRKKKKEKEAEKIEAQLKENELSTEKTVEIIRHKLDEYIRTEFAFIDDQQVHNIVMGITSNLEEYMIPEIPEIVDNSDIESYE